MAITDKSRKILWGRSGNRCAICRQRLVVDETSIDAESVVGDECHINSGALGGPRYDAAIEQQSIDDLANLLLLCRVHHKMVDDQFETYTAELLQTIKDNHQRWVDSKFKETEGLSTIKVKRFKSEIPAQLRTVESGQELFNLASGCHGSYQNHNDDLSDEDVEIVGGFLQNLQYGVKYSMGSSLAFIHYLMLKILNVLLRADTIEWSLDISNATRYYSFHDDQKLQAIKHGVMKKSEKI